MTLREYIKALQNAPEELMDLPLFDYNPDEVIYESIDNPQPEIVQDYFHNLGSEEDPEYWARRDFNGKLAGNGKKLVKFVVIY